MLRCRLLGHRFHFTSDGGTTMSWHCGRGCGAGGSKRYRTAQEADRYATALDRDDVDALGRRALPFGLLPLRIARLLRRRGLE